MNLRKKKGLLLLIIVLFISVYVCSIKVVMNNLSSYKTIGKKTENMIKKTIIFSDDLDYPPYSFIDKNGNPSGFNVELIKAVGEVMGYKVEIQLDNWNNVKKNLESGKIDGISGMVYSKEREKKYSFTTKYTVANGDVFTRKDFNIKDIKNLRGKTVVVQNGDISYEYLLDKKLNIKFIPVATIADALKLVSAGRYDYAAIAKLPGHYLIDEINIKNLKANGLFLAPNSYCMAVEKGNDDLLFALNNGLQILKSNGKFDELYNKWLGIYEERTIWQELDKYKWIVITISSLMLLLALWTITLRRQVANKTKELVAANDALIESKEELIASNEELEASFHQLAAFEEELRQQYDQLAESEEKLKKSEERNKAIVVAMPDLLFIVDDKGYFKDCQSREDIYMIAEKDMFIGKTLWDILPDYIAVEGYEKIKQAIATNKLQHFEYELNTPGGLQYFEVRIVKSRDNEVVVISRDITFRKVTEKALEKEKELLKTTLLSVGEGVISTDSNGKIAMINLMAQNLTGWDKAEVKNKSIEEVFNVIEEDTREKCVISINDNLKTSKQSQSFENKILITKDNKEILISYNIASINMLNGDFYGFVLVFRDVTVARKNQKRIEYLSYHDQLTGLYNRRFFEEIFKKLYVKENLPLTIVMADVNGLKLINDSFGHAIGDELLKKVAKVMIKGCREDDIISRIGGDEFVIILPRVGSGEILQIINRIQTSSLKEKVASMPLSISFGWETIQSEGRDLSEVLKKAEDYMYKKKLFESPSMRSSSIGVIIKTLHEKNKREEQHSHRVSIYCENMGKAMKLPDGEIKELKIVGLLHDIGKIAIDENILNKASKLSDSEWEEIKKHPDIGYRILSSVNEMAEMAEYVLAHHERWDGKGYPKGLNGEEIPLKSRIISIIDAYDAMTSERAYRDALPEEVAIAELRKYKGIQFDAELVDIFINKVLLAD